MIQGLPEGAAVGRGGQDGGTAPEGGMLRHIKAARNPAGPAGALRPLAPPPARVLPRRRRSRTARGVSREHERAGATLRTASAPFSVHIAISGQIQIAL